MCIARSKYHGIITSDVTLVPQSDLTMADVKKAKRNCVGDIALLVPLTSKVAVILRSRLVQECISSRLIRLWGQNGVQFVRRHRHDFKDPASKYTSLCSVHFEDSCYVRSPSILSSMEAQGLKMKAILKKDVVPTRDSVIVVLCSTGNAFNRTIEGHFTRRIGDFPTATKLARTD